MVLLVKSRQLAVTLPIIPPLALSLSPCLSLLLVLPVSADRGYVHQRENQNQPPSWHQSERVVGTGQGRSGQSKIILHLETSFPTLHLVKLYLKRSLLLSVFNIILIRNSPSVIWFWKLHFYDFTCFLTVGLDTSMLYCLSLYYEVESAKLTIEGWWEWMGRRISSREIFLNLSLQRGLSPFSFLPSINSNTLRRDFETSPFLISFIFLSSIGATRHDTMLVCTSKSISSVKELAGNKWQPASAQQGPWHPPESREGDLLRGDEAEQSRRNNRQHKTV